jgi:hypothetical protein
MTTFNNLNTRYMTIKITLDLLFTSTGTNTKTYTLNSGVNDNYSYLSAECVILNGIGLTSNQAYITIYGMLLEDIITLTRSNITGYLLYTGNQVQVYAGYTLDNQDLPPLVYSGQIRTAGGNLNNPNREFMIASMQSLNQQSVIAPTTNVKGNISLDSLLKTIANASGFTYSGNDIQGIVENPIYKGSFINKINQICEHYNLHYAISNLSSSTLLVAQQGQPLFTSSAYIINATSGMLGYPTIEEQGISVRVRHNPVLQIGLPVQVESLYTWVNDQTYYISAMQHVLQNQEAKWESTLKLTGYFGSPT